MPSRPARSARLPSPFDTNALFSGLLKKPFVGVAYMRPLHLRSRHRMGTGRVRRRRFRGDGRTRRSSPTQYAMGFVGADLCVRPAPRACPDAGQSRGRHLRYGQPQSNFPKREVRHPYVTKRYSLPGRLHTPNRETRIFSTTPLKGAVILPRKNRGDPG